MTPTEMLTVADVARITKLTEPTIRLAVRAGELAASKLRGRILIHPDDLAAWIDQGRLRAIDALPDTIRPAARVPGRKVSYMDLARQKDAA